MRQLNLDSQQNLVKKIEKWKAGLADLGRRNPLIKFRQDSPRSLEILTMEPELIFKYLIEDRQVLYFQSNDDVQSILSLGQANKTKKVIYLKTRQQDDEQLKRLKRLRNEARISLEERGVNSLFLAFGMLNWYDKDKPDEALLSPLILIPVELIKEPRRDIYKISVLEEDVVLNPTLLLRLKQSFGIEFPEGELIQEATYNELVSQIRKLLAGQETWEIKENIFLSLFSYAKSAMVRDIIENEDRIFAHPILQAISGNLDAYQMSCKEPLPVSALDSQIIPERIFQILDADSSQQAVIEVAKGGSSFVVQGPPGTGKSQTIVNIIAELIGAGKSVLLVAEKDTALRVVYQRMEECGLSHLCLNLHHNGTTDKRKFIKNLSDTIAYSECIVQQFNTSNYNDFFTQLVLTRQSISSYLESLHSKEKPLNKSSFELFGEILKKQREGLPDLNIRLSGFLQWTPSRLQEAKSLLNRLAGFLPFFSEEVKPIWSNTSLSSYSYEMELELNEKVSKFEQALDKMQSICKELHTPLQTQNLSSVESLEKYVPALACLSSIPSELPVNWNSIDLAEMQSALEKLKNDVKILEQGRPYQPSISLQKQEVFDLYNRFQDYSNFWLFRFLNPEYKTDLESIKKLCNIKESIPHIKLKQGLVQALRVPGIKDELNQSSYPAYKVFGSLFRASISKQAEIQPIEDVARWLIDWQKYRHMLSDKFINSMVDSLSERRRICQLVSDFQATYCDIDQGIKFLDSYFSRKDITDQYLYLERIPFAELKSFLEKIRNDLPHLYGWLTYKETCNQLEALGLSNFLDELRSNRIDSKHWFSALEKLIYQTCLDNILVRKSELRSFSFEGHEQQIKDFVDLDYGQLSVARERLKYVYAEKWQNFEQTSIAQSELTKLRREETKKKQHFPIRKLLNDQQKGVQNLVKVLKPCWMMSPLSVSQYIDPNVIHFDVLIFDEASQLRTEDVVSSIIRSDQIIVIGDRQQLPPTSFFLTENNDEEIDDEANESYESILDECSTFMIRCTLKWHYRSQDERLIAFSNRHFYDSQLVTFPNPIQNPDLGVWFKHVPNGVYSRGGRRDNRHEAETVAQLVLEHVQQCSHQSLGIIAFSEAQADAIQERIEILGKKNPEVENFCRDDSPQFFLKALENVQGDERDVILLSIGYARDCYGKLYLNFGPLNKQGGERRLNVAITRSKRKITVISSICAGDIDLTRTQSEGVRLLRDYLKFAESRGKRLKDNSYTDNLCFDSPFEEDVYHAIRENPLMKDYVIRTQVGCSGYRIDLAIAHNNCPGEFLLGIECDGASYHSSPTARDRDRLRQQVLEGLGWKIHRIWSTEWFRNKPEQVRLLMEKINKPQ